MRTFVISVLFLLSFMAQAQEKSVVFPQLTVWPNSVDVRIWNTTDKTIYCSGPIYIYSQSNRFKTEYFNRYITPRSHAYQSFHNFNINDPYRNAHHSIFCH